MLTEDWLVDQLASSRNDMIFRGHYSERGNPRRQFAAVVLVEPIARLHQDFSPFLGQIKFWETPVALGWGFSVTAYGDASPTSSTPVEQMKRIKEEWRQKVRGWDREKVRYCSTDRQAGYDIPMDNIGLIIDFGRIHGAIISYSGTAIPTDRERRVLNKAEGVLRVMISTALIRDGSRHQRLT